ncbi:MAG: hypothetical protein AAGF88_08800 [Pseudomonadota bacterium]
MTPISFSISVSLALFGTASHAQDSWVVDSARAACLIQHIDSYLSGTSGDPVVVVLPACPEADTDIALGMMQQNSGAQPRVTVLPEGRTIDDVIFFSRAELGCLRGLPLDLSAETVLLPYDPCG